MRHGHRLILISLAGLAIVAALAWVAFRPVPVEVELAAVTRGPMTVTVDVDGRTRIREVYEVAAPIAGTTLRSPVRVGDRVTAGETVVARVEPVSPSLLDARARVQAEAAVREAEAALTVARAQLRHADEDVAYAASQLERAQALLERGVATVARVEDAAQSFAEKEAARDAAAASVAMSEGALDRTRAALIGPSGGSSAAACCIDILAPSDGVVLSVARVSARPVAAGEVLLAIGAPADLEIVAEPLSRDALRFPDGAAAEVLDWGGDRPLGAHLLRVDPAAFTKVSALGIEEQRVEAVFLFDAPPASARPVGTDYSVFLRVAVWRSEDAVQVPQGALFRDGGGWAVYVVAGGQASLRAVEPGERNAEVAQVVSGLAPGEEVVLHPNDKIADGVAVTPILRK